VPTKKVAAIYKESAEKYEKIQLANKGNTSKIATDVKSLSRSTTQKIKSLLTAAQAVKFNKLVKGAGANLSY